MTIDLHIHSSASDGGFTPIEVVEYAGKIGLHLISITDHDTVEGLSQADEKAHELKIDFITGIEFTTYAEGREKHILGYFIDYKSESFLKDIKEVQNNIETRVAKMIYNLNNLGFDITLEEVKEVSSGNHCGRPHIAKVMLNKGYVETFHEVFDKYIGLNGEAFVDTDMLSPQRAYEIIKSAGGISSLAHPGAQGISEMITDEDIYLQKEMGLDAVEVFHSRHDDYFINYYLKTARKLGMHITGGSDCHGPIYSKILMDNNVCPDWVGEKLINFMKNKDREEIYEKQ